MNDLRPTGLKSLVGGALGVAAWVVGILYFYRGFFRTGFRFSQGDFGDGRLTAAIANHWSSPLLFTGGFTDTGIFYPFGHGLMYSDTLFIFGVLESPLIRLGLDSTVAFQWTLILTSTIGYFCTLGLLRIGPKSPWVLAIGAAFVVAFSNGLVVASSHPQLIAIELLPASALTGLAAMRRVGRWNGPFFAILSGLLFGCVAYSAFYIGWFAALGAAIALTFWACLSWHASPTRRVPIRVKRVALLWAIGAAILIPLFAITYGPLLASGAARSMSEVERYLLDSQDLLAVSPTNVLWFRPLYGLFHGMSEGERAMAPTPVLLAVSIALTTLGFFRKFRHETWGRLGLSVTLAGLVMWLVPVRVGSFIPWEFLRFLPGAGAIRAVGRVELISGLLLTIGAALLATVHFNARRQTRPVRTAMGLIIVLILAEQANFLMQQNVDISSIAKLREVSDPPKECQSFGLGGVPKNPRAEDGQTDAAIISQSKGIPTWNGASGGVPDGWTLTPMSDATGYLKAVNSYPFLHQLTGPCLLFLPDGDWQPWEGPIAPHMRTTR